MSRAKNKRMIFHHDAISMTMLPPYLPSKNRHMAHRLASSAERQTKKEQEPTHGGLTESMVWPAGMGSVLRTSLALVPMLLAPHFDADADSREAAARESEALQLSMVALAVLEQIGGIDGRWKDQVLVNTHVSRHVFHLPARRRPLISP